MKVFISSLVLACGLIFCGSARADLPDTRPSPAGTLGEMRVEGPGIFTYHGMTADPDKEFTLDVGVVVKDGSTKPDGFEMASVPSTFSALMVYAGDVSHLPAAYGKLYGAIAQRGLQPSDVSWEIYYYWEDRQSDNNLIGIQVELQPTN